MFFKRDKEYNNVIHLSFIKCMKCSKNIINSSLDINKRIAIIHNKNIENVLTFMRRYR